MKIKTFAALVLAGAVIMAPAAAVAATDTTKLDALQRMIERQQRIIDAQARTLDALKDQVEALRAATEANAEAMATQARAGPARAAPNGGAPAAPAKTVSSGEEKVSLAISGQVNRGILYTRDGRQGEIFHVDNDNSSTRVRLIGKARLGDDVTMGTQIEVQMESNSTVSINQTTDNGVGGAAFTERKLELYLDSKQFGWLWLGQGDTASNGTSEVDLSGTSVVGHSAIQEMAGGILFVNDVTNAFGPSIGTVFNNLDGLSRDDRVRYDTPTFLGFKASASHISGGAVDGALRYAAG